MSLTSKNLIETPVTPTGSAPAATLPQTSAAGAPLTTKLAAIAEQIAAITAMEASATPDVRLLPSQQFARPRLRREVLNQLRCRLVNAIAVAELVTAARTAGTPNAARIRRLQELLAWHEGEVADQERFLAEFDASSEALLQAAE